MRLYRFLLFYTFDFVIKSFIDFRLGCEMLDPLKTKSANISVQNRNQSIWHSTTVPTVPDESTWGSSGDSKSNNDMHTPKCHGNFTKNLPHMIHTESEIRDIVNLAQLITLSLLFFKIFQIYHTGHKY